MTQCKRGCRDFSKPAADDDVVWAGIHKLLYRTILKIIVLLWGRNSLEKTPTCGQNVLLSKPLVHAPCLWIQTTLAKANAWELFIHHNCHLHSKPGWHYSHNNPNKGPFTNISSSLTVHLFSGEAMGSKWIHNLASHCEGYHFLSSLRMSAGVMTISRPITLFLTRRCLTMLPSVKLRISLLLELNFATLSLLL